MPGAPTSTHTAGQLVTTQSSTKDVVRVAESGIEHDFVFQRTVAIIIGEICLSAL